MTDRRTATARPNTTPSGRLSVCEPGQDEEENMTRYVIIGAGAVGASLAAQFELTGINYVLVGRGAQITHIRQHGLTYQRPSATRQIHLNAFDLAEPPALTADDILC